MGLNTPFNSGASFPQPAHGQNIGANRSRRDGVRTNVETSANASSHSSAFSTCNRSCRAGWLADWLGAEKLDPMQWFRAGSIEQRLGLLPVSARSGMIGALWSLKVLSEEHDASSSTTTSVAIMTATREYVKEAKL